MNCDHAGSQVSALGSKRAVRTFAIAAALLLAGCAATTIKRGHQFSEGDVQQVQPGMTQDAVRMALGTPDTTSTVSGNNTFYYISSTTRQQASFLKEDEVDRKVVAVYFNPAGSVDKVAHYGLKDGAIIDYNKGETPAYMRDKNFISRFFRGVGPKATLPEK